MRTETYSTRINGRDLVVTDGMDNKGKWGFEIELLAPIGGYATEMERRTDRCALREAIIAAMPWRGLIWGEGYFIDRALVKRFGFLSPLSQTRRLSYGMQVWATNFRSIWCKIEDERVDKVGYVTRCSLWGCEDKRDCEDLVDAALAALADTLPKEEVDVTMRELARMAYRGEREPECAETRARATLDALTAPDCIESVGGGELFLGRATVGIGNNDKMLFLANRRQLIRGGVNPDYPPLGEAIDFEGAIYACVDVAAPRSANISIAPCVLADRVVAAKAGQPGHLLILRVTGSMLTMDEANNESRCAFSFFSSDKMGTKRVGATLLARDKADAEPTRGGWARVALANKLLGGIQRVWVEGHASFEGMSSYMYNWNIRKVTGLRVDGESVFGDSDEPP